MRYIAYATDGPSMIGRVTDTSVAPLASIDAFYADPDRFLTAEPVGEGVPLVSVTQVPPVPPTAQVLCNGLNYADHIEEVGRDRPEAPNIFARWYRTLVCDNADIPVPSGEPGLDWEGELAVIIGKEMTDVSEEEAMAGVFGYSCFLDISARTHQRRTPQWALGKNPKNSGPIGPVVVTADEFGDPYTKRLQTRWNDEVVQETGIDLMLFSIAETLSYSSKCITLYPGDVLATGTPAGVGSKRTPPVFMNAGDRVEVEIDGLGILRANIV